MNQPTVKDVFAYLNEIAPVEMGVAQDNVGHLIGRGDRPVNRVLIALDITEEVIQEAVDIKSELIVSHHPLIFAPLYRVTDQDLVGRKVLTLIRHDMAAICMHTNLDAVQGGVNDVLADALGLRERAVLCPGGEDAEGNPYGLGRMGLLPAPLPMAEFLRKVSQVLQLAGLRYHDAGVPVHRVGLMGGSGSGEFGRAAMLGCDTYIAGDIKYHTFLEARELGVNLIDGDHYSTENVICSPLRDWLWGRFPQLEVFVSRRHSGTAQFFQLG